MVDKASVNGDRAPEPHTPLPPNTYTIPLYFPETVAQETIKAEVENALGTKAPPHTLTFAQERLPVGGKQLSKVDINFKLHDNADWLTLREGLRDQLKPALSKYLSLGSAAKGI